MKKLTYLIAALLILSTTSMMLTQKNDSQKKTELTTSDETKPLFYKGMITIKLKPDIGELEAQRGMVHINIQSLDEIAEKFSVNLLEKRFRYNPKKLRSDLPDLSSIYRIEFPEEFSVTKVARKFSKDPNIEYAEPIPVNYPDGEPDDDLYEQCQHLPQIFARDAWDIHHGEDGAEVVIAIIDNGTDWKHPDLINNIWQNLGEDANNNGRTLVKIGGEWVFDPADINNIDDDGNGFIDDFIGWDFYIIDNDPDHNSGELHGTHTMGIAAGVTNNDKGIASISWNVKAMPVLVNDTDGYFIWAYDGIIYAAENGADIISNSWSGTVYSQANHEVINYVTGLGSIVVASTGNHNSLDLHYPASYPGVLSIASVSVDDSKASYSAFGPSVDISAPGGGSEGGILSTLPDGNYGVLSGTSMSCPLIAGCLGLLKSFHPTWSNEQLITQMIGTSDNIDTLNPDYHYLLGSGRVNALHMLTEENVTIPQEFKFELTETHQDDENGNKINEPGELVTLNFEFRNYISYLGEDNVTVLLETNDPEIILIDGTATVDIPPDDFFTIEDQFQIQVAEDASSHFAQFTIHFESDIPVVYGQDEVIQVLVAPSGIFVFEGEENGQDYSGTFIRTFLEDIDYESTYSNLFPQSLKGFETVFLSHGNVGQALDKGSMVTEERSLCIQEFLEDGGNVYIEHDGLFSGMFYFGFSNLPEMMQLFGVSDFAIVSGENLIDSLIGVEESPFEGIVFSGSNQLYNWYIDDLEPAEGATVPFYEYDYGNVSIMNDGSETYGHKVFYISYSLAELIDRNAMSSRYNVLLKIMEFFDYEIPEGYLLSNFIADKQVGGSPLEVQFTDISLSDPAYPVISWQWDFNNDGTIDSEEQHPVWTFQEMGNYDVKLITSNGFKTDTLIIEEYITVNDGYLVYEGVPDGANYSGVFITDYLIENNNTVTYKNTFPASLDGYSAVFLSFGNSASDYTPLNVQIANVLYSYIEAGGYVYLEGGEALGFDQSANSDLLNLFGIISAFDGTSNEIDYLEGQQDAVTYDILFTSSSQHGNSYIDIYEPAEGAIAAFEESDYGIVAVQNTGDFDQKTFCFSYALADLDDNEFPSTREELLTRICEFFGIYVDVETREIELPDLNIFPNPCISSTNISYALTEKSQVVIEVYNSTGQRVQLLFNAQLEKGEYRLNWNAASLNNGIYFIRLHMGNEIITKKIVRL